MCLSLGQVPSYLEIITNADSFTDSTASKQAPSASSASTAAKTEPSIPEINFGILTHPGETAPRRFIARNIANIPIKMERIAVSRGPASLTSPPFRSAHIPKLNVRLRYTCVPYYPVTKLSQAVLENANHNMCWRQYAHYPLTHSQGPQAKVIPTSCSLSRRRSANRSRSVRNLKSYSHFNPLHFQKRTMGLTRSPSHSTPPPPPPSPFFTDPTFVSIHLTTFSNVYSLHGAVTILFFSVFLFFLSFYGPCVISYWSLSS